MEYTLHTDDHAFKVNLRGSFTYSDNQKFKEILSSVTREGVSSVWLDFSEVDFIDSAGLGMLLLLRDTSRDRNIQITLSKPKGQARKMFELSRFDQLFTIQ